MRPGSNTESERRTTQGERAEGVIGRGEATIEIGFAQSDGERGECAVDAPSLSG